MNNLVRQRYLNEMGIITWRLRAANDGVPVPAAFVYQIEANQKDILLMASFQETQKHSIQQATALVTAICIAIGDHYQGEYISHLDQTLSPPVAHTAIILGESLYQQCLSSLNGATVIYATQTMNELLDHPDLKDNIWRDILGLQ